VVQNFHRGSAEWHRCPLDLLRYGLQDGNKSIPTLQSVSRPQVYDSDTILTPPILMRAPTLAEGRGAADASIETTSVFVVQSEDSYVQAVPDTIPWASIEIGTSGYFTRDGTRGDRFGDDFPWMASRMARTPLPGGNRAQPPREIIRAVIGDEHVERVLARA